MSLTKNLGRVRLVWQGEYDEETQYTYLDAVSYEGSSYMCFTETPPPVGTLPTDEDYFLVLAEKGAPSDATENSYLWLKESGSVVQCYPVPESELDLKVYFAPVETLPAEGEKGPENPSTISGWDSVEVVRCGKNLFDINGVTNWGTGAYVNDTDNGRIVQENTSSSLYCSILPYTKGRPLCLSSLLDTEEDLPAVPATKHYDVQFKKNGVWSWAMGTTTHIDSHNVTGLVQQLQVPEGAGATDWRLSVTSAVNRKNTYYNFQLELGNTATTYEPYIGNTYTITLPDTFYGGYVDFERGVLVQTHQKITFDGTEDWVTSSPGVDVFQYNAPLLIGYYYPINNFFTQGVPSADTTEVCVTANGGYDATGRSRIAVWNVGEQLGYTTLDAWKTYLAQLATAGNPLEVVYKLFTPIEHPLEDLVPIKALTQTDRYTSQLNTVYANTNGDIELGYAKSPIQEHLDLTNAITATGGANV